jgi:hypothetical protein
MPPPAANRKPAFVRRPGAPAYRNGNGSPRNESPRNGSPRPGKGAADKRGANGEKAEHEILFQTYFKSVGPRTYAAQVKRASNDNHYVVLTEGKRDEKTGEVRKARLFVYSEDFIPFFRMLQETAQFIRVNPVPDEVKKKRDQYWAKKASEAKVSSPARPSGPATARPALAPRPAPAARPAPPVSAPRAAAPAVGTRAVPTVAATPTAKSPGASAPARDRRPAPPARSLAAARA